ncbi:cadherin domain-containing protein [Chitinophagaceae bacterium LB-8]|uniref:Cadherin domain-containing protein n=1 Tax=Paraflavisolibacter caeni TaxID=2982496 RepID=A0A9X2XXL3_9BACT|nr:cadherin domain-containing protein [Paraflavisolibacter caeni]MCU7550621.1 cadherin domain-containing protein [Paraflavisolibacter caeni]
MKLGSTFFYPSLSFHLPITWLLVVLIISGSFEAALAQCPPISTLPCGNVQVSLPVSLSFSSSVAGTITDKNGAGTGFTMVDAYSGTRLTQDGTPSNSSVPGYEAAQLTLGSGRLQILTNKGIAYLTNNNQINALGVKVDSRGLLRLETTLINPFNGTSSQQGGLWFGLGDKTFVKLSVSANKVELRRELNDLSSTVSGTSNPDQRITGTIANLNTMIVRLRLVVDPTANTAEGFYSTDGVSYVNVGAAYSPKTVSIAGMGLTASTAYGGIYATHRNATTAVTYSFEDFSISQPSAGNTAPVFSPASYSYSLQDDAAVGSLVGQVSASDANGDALSYSIVSGNTNGAFSINASTGQIRVAKTLNYHSQSSYSLVVRASDGGGLADNASTVINVANGTNTPDFSAISWGSAASEPYGTHEIHGAVVDGKLYIFGGYDILKRPSYWTPTKRSFVYDPATNSWSAIADLPHTPNGADFGGITHEGLATDGTDIYFAGGYKSNSTGTGQVFGTKQVFRYNVATNTYTALPNLPVELAAGQLQYLNGKLHYMGGANLSRADVAIHYALDLDNLPAGWKAMAPLSDPRNHPGSAVFEGKIYFIGGAHHQDAATVTQKTVEVYDPNTDTWTRVADMPIGLDHISSAVTVIGNRILVLGGETSHNVKSKRVLAYTPSTNTWVDLTPLPETKSAGVGVTLKGAIYYAGGNFSTLVRKGAPGAATTQQVATFTLINAETDQPIQTLTNGSTLNLATLPSRSLNIRANTNPSTVGSVVFALTGAQTKNVIESRAPYALFGDNNSGDYYGWTPATGSYTLKATPFTSTGGAGTAGTSLTVGFTVVDQAATTSTISENQTLSQVKLYPNPSKKSDVHLEVQNIGQHEKITLYLIDMSGHLLEVRQLTTDNNGNASTIFSVSKQLLAGIYLIQIQLPLGQIQRRLFVD